MTPCSTLFLSHKITGIIINTQISINNEAYKNGSTAIALINNATMDSEIGTKCSLISIAKSASEPKSSQTKKEQDCPLVVIAQHQSSS